MTNNLNITYKEKELADFKNNEELVSESQASYRGFASIDQEMERDIAMQWFSPSAKKIYFHGIVVSKGSCK